MSVLTLNNGFKMPVVGLGTYASLCGEVTQAVKDAIDVGYRHFDCAYFYGNEAEVGTGIRAKIEDGTVKREDLFITSKLWNTFHPFEMVVPNCKLSLQNLGLDYLDLYLIHWPFAWKEGNNLWPTKNGQTQFSDVDYLDTWQGMEKCVEMGLTRSIGLSNFNSEQINRILNVAKIKPVNNQVEANPYLNQKNLIKFCEAKEITLTAYCPLGRPMSGESVGFSTSSIHDQVIINVSKKYNKTPAQIVLKYMANLGISVIPKSVNKSRIVENIQIFDFDLKSEDVKKIDALNRNYRICGLEDNKTHKYYPFNIEY